MMMKEKPHSYSASGWKALLIVGALLAYVFTIVGNTVLNVPGISPFNETIGNLSHKYYTPITPADATFGIWGLIYLWLLALVIYCSTLLCRNCNGSPLYVNPGVVPSIFFIYLIINLLGNVGWIYVWLEEWLVSALCLLLIGVLTAYICLKTSCGELEKSGAVLEAGGFTADIWCTRILVQNGIALYLAWVTCATGINAVVVLYYVLGISMTQACFAVLITLNVIVVSWFILETVYDRQLRYVFAHYIAYIAAFYGIHVQNFDPAVNYEVYALVLLFLLMLLAVAKLVIMIVRAVKDPIHYPQAQSSEKVKFTALKSYDTM